MPNAASAISGLSLLVAGCLAIEATFSSAQVSPDEWVRARCRSRLSVLGFALERIFRPRRSSDGSPSYETAAEPASAPSPSDTDPDRFAEEAPTQRDADSALARASRTLRKLEEEFGATVPSVAKGLGAVGTASFAASRLREVLNALSFLEDVLGRGQMSMQEFGASLGELRRASAEQQDQQRFVGESVKRLALPIQTIVADSAELLSKLSRADPNYRNVLHVFEVAQGLRSTVDSILDVVGAGGWGTARPTEHVSIETPLKKAIAMLQTEAEQEGRRIVTFRIAEGQSLPHVNMNVDELTLAFTSVLRNAVHNSFKSTSDAPIPEISIECRHDDKSHCEVRVTYVGVNPVGHDADLASVFAPAYRRAPSTRSRAEGSGFGLYFAKRAIESHAGSVAMTASELVGSRGGYLTTIEIRLPVSQDDDNGA